jgi:hypothetical protein
MNYIIIIPEDTILIIISKIKDKNDILNFQSSNINVNQLLSKSSTWKILINYKGVRDPINKDYTLSELKLIYNLCLLNPNLALSYIDYLHINMESVGYRNINKITSDQIYNVYSEYTNILISKNIFHISSPHNFYKYIKTYLNEMFEESSINNIIEFLILIYLLEIKKIKESIPEIRTYHNGSISFLVKAYQINYNIYLKLSEFYKNNLTNVALQNIVNDRSDEQFYGKYDGVNGIYFNLVIYNQDKILVISDLKNRWNL